VTLTIQAEFGHADTTIEPFCQPQATTAIRYVGTMKTLIATSWISVLCAASIGLFAVPQLVGNGVVETGPLMEVMVLLPTPIGLFASLVGVVSGIEVVARSAEPSRSPIVLTIGHVLTCGLAVAIVVWAINGSTGWELIVLPTSLIVGQLVVLTGLLTFWWRLRTPAR